MRTALTPQPPLPQAGEGEPDNLIPNPRPLAGEGGAQRRVRASAKHRAPRVLLSGYYGFANAGDEAVLAGLIASLRAARPDWEIVVLSGNPRETEATHGVRAAHRYRAQELLPALARTDVLLSGGGSLLQDVTSAHSVFYYLGVVRLAQMLGKRTLFGAQGVGPLRLPRTRRLVAGVANRLDAVTVRDSQSAALLREIGVVRPGVEVVADPALLLGPALPSPVANTYGVALRSWRGQDVATQVAVACGAALPGAKSRVFAMQTPADLEVGQEFAARASSHTGVMAGQDLGTLVQEIARCEMMVGMRLHALILAAACGVPSVALSYDPKVAAFMAQSGQGDAVWDLERQDLGQQRVPQAEGLDEILARCWQARAARAEALRSRLPELRRLAGRTGEVAAELVA